MWIVWMVWMYGCLMVYYHNIGIMLHCYTF